MESAIVKELALDKTSWQPVILGDVVKEVRTSTKDPAADGIKHVVGLEHIESEDIHLRSSAGIEASTTFTKRFSKGDVLFGRRRAYLKKAALAPFAGICSGDITVLRAKEKLIPELLPFLIHNDKFFDYAVKHSAGGLSPRVKFKALANYPFLLPPKAEQARLAELLWALDAVVEGDSLLLNKLNQSKRSVFKESVYLETEEKDKYFGKYKSRYPVKKLGSLVKSLQYGVSESLDEYGEIPILRMNNISDGKLDLKDLKYLSPKRNELKDFILEKGDILFNRTNSYELVGKTCQFSHSGTFSFASYIIRIKTKNELLAPAYLNFYFNTEIGLGKIRKYRTAGVSQSNINAKNIKKIPVPLPPIERQREIVSALEKIENSELTVSQRMGNTKSLQKSLINQIF